MTINVSRRSLLALGAGLGASTMLGGSAPGARAEARHANALLASLRARRRRGDGGFRRPVAARRSLRHFYRRAEGRSEEDAVGQLPQPRQRRAGAELPDREHRQQN